MKVKDLIIELQALPQDHDIVMAQDSEGNSFGPFGGLCSAMYVPETTYYGYLRDAEEPGEYAEDPYVENAVVIWPIN